MISFVTAVYNREQLVIDLYNSLSKQTDLDFEWLVIDDGSSDNTFKVLKELESNANFKMKVFTHDNSGKHKSINYITKYSSEDTKLYVFIDSDDVLLPHAAKYIKKIWDGVYDNDKDSYVGLYCKFIFDSDCEAEDKCHVDFIKNGRIAKDVLCKNSDFLPVVRKDLFDNENFPEFDSENFIPESSVWDKLLMKRGIIFPSRPIAIVRYQPDGLSSKILRLRLNNPKGTLYTYLQASKSNFSLKFKLASLINYYRFSIHFKSKLDFFSYFSPFYWLGYVYFYKDKKCKNNI